MTEKKIFFISRGSFNPVRDPTKSLGCLGESTAVKGILKFFLEGFPKSSVLRPKVREKQKVFGNHDYVVPGKFFEILRSLPLAILRHNIWL